MTVHYKTEAMIYVACKRLLDDGIEKLETTDQPSLVTCERCKRAFLSPVHYATSPHTTIACKRKVIAMHVGMKSWTRDKSKISCEHCLRILGEMGELDDEE